MLCTDHVLGKQQNVATSAHIKQDRLSLDARLWFATAGLARSPPLPPRPAAPLPAPRPRAAPPTPAIEAA